MKRFTSYLLVLAMLVSCFATVFVTTASAEATILSVGKSYSTTATLHVNMPDGGNDLTDGSKSNPNVTDNEGGPYVGYSVSGAMDIILDLGSAQQSNVFTIYTAQNFWGIAIPTNLAISYSDSENGSYTAVSGTVVSAQVGTGDEVLTSSGTYATSQLYTLTFTASNVVNARFIKFTITPKGSFIWLDEIEAAYDASAAAIEVPEGSYNVHHVNESISNGQTGVFTTLADMATDVSGWGVFYQLHPTGNTNEYSIVAASNNPGVKEDEFITKTGFTEVSGDLYLTVNGAAANPDTYNLSVGTIITFINLPLVEGAYSDAYMYLGSLAGNGGEITGTGEFPSSGRSYTVSVTPRDTFSDDSTKLTDGSKSNPAVAGTDSDKYVGFDVSGTLEIILNLGSAKETDTYVVYTAQNFWGISVPDDLKVSYSATEYGVYTELSGDFVSAKVGDGTAYTSVSGVDYVPELYTLSFNSDKIVNAQYIKFTLTTDCASIWLDEIEAKLSGITSVGSSYTATASNRSDMLDDGSKLTDGVRSTADFQSDAYATWVMNDTVTEVEVIIDLGEAKATDTYTLYSIENFWGVWCPDTFTVSYSDSADGTYTAVSGTITSTKVADGRTYTSSNDGIDYTAQLYEITLTAESPVTAQYIKFNITPTGSFVWLDEVEASLGGVVNAFEIVAEDSGSDDGGLSEALRVHHVDKTVSTNEISVFTTLSNISSVANGWGAYYQLRQTVNTNEYMVVAASNNPRDGMDSFTASDFITKTGFTQVASWAAKDVYMQVNGGAVNKAVYYLEVGDIVTFTNLTLTAGDYTDTYVAAGAASGTIAGMINNAIEETNLMHSVANVQVTDSANVSALLSAENAPANAFFSGNADYNAILKACVANKVLPTVQIDTATQATSLINAMKATGCYDVNVMSADVAVLQAVRNATKIARTGLIYSLTKSEITSVEAGVIRGAVRSAPATFVVFDSTNVSKQVVAELQELGVAVWVKTSSAATGTDEFNVEIINTLTTGANGIITVSASEVSALIEKHFAESSFTRTPTAVGHRGYPAKATENTLASFIKAYEYGADVFELDIYSTSDNGLVLFHDYSFGTSEGLRLTTFTGTADAGRIENMTLAQVQQITYKDGTPITQFKDVLEYFKGKDVRIFVEFKGSGLARTVEYTAKAVKEYGMEDQIVVISSSGAYLQHTVTYFGGQVTGSYVYANESLTGYAPETTPAWQYAETREENLTILAYTLGIAQTYNANISPLCSAVSLGFNKDNFLGEATTNRGIALNPWTYGSAGNNNIGFFSDVDSITTDVTDWFTNMAKFVSAEDVTLVVGQKYAGAGFTATTYGRETYDIDSANIVYSIISGDSVEVQDGKLVAVKNGESKVIMGYRTTTSSGTEYVLYSEVVTVNVDSGSVDVLKPLIELAETMTVKDFSEADLITLRELHAEAVKLVSNNSTDETAIAEVAIALTELLDKRYENTVSDVNIGSYTAPEANYYKWDPTIGAQGSELHPDYIDDGIRLTDGIKSTESGYSTAYSVWQNIDVDIDVNLGESANSNIYHAYFAYGVDGIAAPDSMTISYKDANGNWQTVTGTCTRTVISDTAAWDLCKLTFIADSVVNAQEIRFSIKRSGIFVWMDEVEVQYASGSQVHGDYIYVNGFNAAIDSGDSFIYTSDFGEINTTTANHRYTANIIAKWSDYHNAYIVTSVTDGTGDSTPAVNLADDEIFLAVHDWEETVPGSAVNKERAQAVKEGQMMIVYGLDIESKTLGIAPYVRFIDTDHTCSAANDTWYHDETTHWHLCECGKKVDVADHSAQGDIRKDETNHWYECTCGEKINVEAHNGNDVWAFNETEHYHECDCGTVYGNEAHTLGAEADCENAQTCTVCDHVAAKATGHSYEWVVSKEAEIGVEGLKEHKCTACGDVDDTEIIPALEDDNFILGDVNRSGDIDMMDYILLKRNYFGTFCFDEDQLKRGDCNRSGDIDMMDYILLKRAYFGTFVLK